MNEQKKDKSQESGEVYLSLKTLDLRVILLRAFGGKWN